MDKRVHCHWRRSFAFHCVQLVLYEICQSLPAELSARLIVVLDPVQHPIEGVLHTYVVCPLRLALSLREENK